MTLDDGPNMKDACFVAPIHYQKFNFGLDFVKSYNHFYNDDHIYLVFSDQEEYDHFKVIAEGLRYRSLICPPLASQSPTTEKKFYGLQQIYATTDFINVAAVDIDTTFFRTIDYAFLFGEYYKRGIIYGNDYEYLPWPIVESPLKFFNEQDQKIIFDKTGGYRAYFWFNDVPVYNREHFLNFCQYINYDQRQHELKWIDFDFIIYAYYLLIKDLFRIEPFLVNGLPLNAIFIENQPLIPEEIFQVLFYQARPMWIRKEIEPRYMPNTFMKVHVDRPWNL